MKALLLAALVAQDIITFKAPEAWKKEEPSSNMRKGQYRIPDKEKTAKDAELAIFYFGAGAGGIKANVDRWAGQMGATDVKAEMIEGAHKIHLIDLKGTYTGDAAAGPQAGARMLGAIVEAGDGPWFFKLVGPADTVGDWKDEYVAMLKAAKR
ncbi:MAG TPA: hypothetical protein VF950_24410 [Planctomycetota bacterium]